MAFPTDVVIVDASSADATYSQISLESGRSVRSDASRELGAPRSLTIGHTINGKSINAKDRHLVRLDLVESDPDSATAAVVSGSAYVVIENPRRVITRDMIKDMVVQLKNFLSDANMDKILNNEP